MPAPVKSPLPSAVSQKLCRVCLTPEESQKYVAVFENKEIARIIFNLTGVVMMDVKTPSVICGGCIKEVEAAEKLKLRILDADDFFCTMTNQSEKNLLALNFEEIVDAAPKSKYDQIITTPLFPDQVDALKTPVTKISNSKKRKREDDFDESPKLLQLLPTKSASAPKSEPSPAFPARFGIQRTVIPKSKQTLAREAAEFASYFTKAEPKPSNTKKITKRSQKSSKSKKRRNRGASKSKPKITFECDNCKKLFEKSEDLDKHMKAHEAEEQASKCSLCGEVFTDYKEFYIHYKNAH